MMWGPDVKKVERVCISVPSDLLAEFDKAIREMGFPNRSRAIHEAMRLLISEWRVSKAVGGQVNGAVVMIYDHTRPGLVGAILDIQHENEDLIRATMHIHLDEENCMEVIAVGGEAERIKALAEALRANKGIKRLKIIVM